MTPNRSPLNCCVRAAFFVCFWATACVSFAGGRAAVDLPVGKKAPELSAVRLAEDGSAGIKVALSDFTGKRPVVLIFSSYT